MLYVHLLFCFYRQVSMAAALTIIINNLYSEDQLKVKILYVYICKM